MCPISHPNFSSKSTLASHHKQNFSPHKQNAEVWSSAQGPALPFTALSCCGVTHIPRGLESNRTLQASSGDLRVCRCNILPTPICTKPIHLAQAPPNPSSSRARGRNPSPESAGAWVQPLPFTLPFKNKKGKAFLFIWQGCPAKSLFTAEHFPRCQFCNSGPGCDPLSMTDGFKIKALQEVPAVQVHIGSAWLSLPSSFASL